jgi:hypothetical protein
MFCTKDFWLYKHIFHVKVLNDGLFLYAAWAIFLIAELQLFQDFCH